jgi:dihydropteroate synthase
MLEILAKARHLIDCGADILDIGGESTRPGSLPVTAEEEIQRILPVIECLIDTNLDAILSVDTYKAPVAEAAIKAGAHWINDVWGLGADPGMAGIAARYNTPIILMHNRSQPANADLQARLGGRYLGIKYNDLVGDIKSELGTSISMAISAGVKQDKIIIDPGIGFGKTVEQNLELIDRLAEFRSLGYPILLGVSRKSFIGYTLDLPAGQRLEGTAAAVSIGIARGADIIRVHDFPELPRVIRMTDAIVRRGRKHKALPGHSYNQ